MSGYATQTEMEAACRAARMIELTEDSGSTVNATILTEVITQASRFMDGFLGGRYAVPITEAAALPILASHCVTVAMYRLWSRAGFPGRENPFRDEYTSTVDWLKDIASGKIPLPGGSSATADDTASWGSEPQVFSSFEEETTG